MKIKILIFPLIIVTVLYLIIWFIVPEYGAVKKSEIKLAATNAKLADMESKSANAASLLASLNSNSEDQSLIVGYFPEKKQDEYIVASINSLAGNSGVTVSGLGFSEDVAMQDISVLYDDLGNVIPTETNPVKTFKVSVEATGSYEKIRQFLFSLASINKLNEIDTISIGRGSIDTPDALEAKADLTFSYLEKVKTVAVINEEFFASGNFDMSVAQDIRKKATIEVPQIEIGATGRGNIFAL